MFLILKAAKMYISSAEILKSRFLDNREDIMKKKWKKEHRKEKDCLSDNKMSKLTIMKKEKNKHLKHLTKSNLAEKLIIIIIFSLKKNCNNQLVIITSMWMIYLKSGIKK